MDPVECLKIALDSLRDTHDYHFDLLDLPRHSTGNEEAESRSVTVEALRNLADWLEKGGVPPSPGKYQKAGRSK